MSLPAPNTNGSVRRKNPFSRNSHSPSPASQPAVVAIRPKSAVFTSPLSASHASSHSRNHSFSQMDSALSPPNGTLSRQRSHSSRNTTPATGTFTPKFIKTEELGSGVERVRGIEGENDFSGKRYVWLKDPVAAFVRGWVVEELEGDQLLVQCDDGSVGQMGLIMGVHMLIAVAATDSRQPNCGQSQSRQVRQSRRHGGAYAPERGLGRPQPTYEVPGRLDICKQLSVGCAGCMRSRR